MIFYDKIWEMLILEIYKIYNSHVINSYFNRNNKIIQEKLFFKEIFILISHFLPIYKPLLYKSFPA